MTFALEVLRAKKGDCLLLHSSVNGTEKLALIDGGPGGVYRNFLKKRLKKLKQERSPDEPLTLDYVMVSHVDDDHINGILQLFNDIADGDRTVRIRRLWHNSFDDILSNSEAEIPEAILSQVGTADFGGSIPEVAGADPHAMMVLASVPQGHELRGLAMALNIPVNPDVHGRLFQANAGPVTVETAGVRYTLIGPLQAELEDFQEKFDKWLEEKNLQSSDGEAALAAFTDTNAFNLASIVMVAEKDGKRMLLTGDARGDKILDGLEMTGFLPAGGSVHFDLLKVQHHGSKNNSTADFFRQVTADHYVLSGNGNHGNPHRSMLEMLHEARPDAAYTLHFTYSLAEIDAEREEHALRYNKPWNDQQDSLQSFFVQHGNPNRIIRCGDGTTPHVIAL